MENYKCEDCDRDYGLICLTPVHFGKDRVKIICSYCFGEQILYGDNDKKIYLPSGGMASHKDLMYDENVVYYNVLVY